MHHIDEHNQEGRVLEVREKSAPRFGESQQFVGVDSPEGECSKRQEQQSHHNLVAGCEYFLEGCSLVNDVAEVKQGKNVH